MLVETQIHDMEKSLHAKVPDEDFEDKDQDDRQAQKVLDKHVVFDNPVVITERRQKRNFNRLIEKGRLQSQYQRNAMIVDEAFQVIKFEICFRVQGCQDSKWDTRLPELFHVRMNFQRI